MKSRIVFIRHGITVGNERKLYYGATDVSLSDRGMDILKELAAKGVYPDSEDAEYYTSGMLRTEQTFKILYGDKPHTKIGNLRELNFGKFEMKTYNELDKDPEAHEWLWGNNNDYTPPGGESVTSFSKRIIKGYEELLQKHQLQMLKLRNQQKEALSICVIHGGVISGVMSHIFPGERDNFFAWIPDPGHGYIVHMEDGKAVKAEEF